MDNLTGMEMRENPEINSAEFFAESQNMLDAEVISVFGDTMGKPYCSARFEFLMNNGRKISLVYYRDHPKKVSGKIPEIILSGRDYSQNIGYTIVRDGSNKIRNLNLAKKSRIGVKDVTSVQI
jgi:hypothetical protein